MKLWIAYSLFANVILVTTECAYRYVFKSFWESVPIMIIPIILAQFCLFKLFHQAPHWFLAWMVFSVGNMGLRIAFAVTLGGRLVLGTYLGISLILLGGLLVKMSLD